MFFTVHYFRFFFPSIQIQHPKHFITNPRPIKPVYFSVELHAKKNPSHPQYTINVWHSTKLPTTQIAHDKPYSTMADDISESGQSRTTVTSKLSQKSKKSSKGLENIWECDKIEKFNAPDGKPRWRCLWCNADFAQWNFTKALLHVTKARSNHIKPCSAFISPSYAQLYDDLLQRTQKKRKASTDRAELYQGSINRNIQDTASKLEKYKKTRKKSKSSSSTTSTSSMSRKVSHQTMKGSSNVDDTQSDVSVQDTPPVQAPNITKWVATTYTSSGEKSGNPPGKFRQLKIMEDTLPVHENKLTMAIADMIHSLGLPFSLASEPKFHTVLQLAKNAGSNYQPPNRNVIGKQLLQLNYDHYIDTSFSKALNNAEYYGITLFGDGATIKKTPFLNILVSSISEPAAVLEITDCSEHLSNGGKKNAEYIAGLLKPHIAKFESAIPNSVDLLIFDGASNVQKAGAILEARYPRITVLHGAEHVVSLFFSDILKTPELKGMVTIYKKIYRVFGSGAMHQPYALFQKKSKDFNDGRNIGLIRAADTRMAGYIIAMMRLVRLREPLINTVTSRQFIDMKVPKVLSRLIQSNLFWKHCMLIVKHLTTALCILRLADQKTPAMSELYEMCLVFDSGMSNTRKVFNEISDSYLSMLPDADQSSIDINTMLKAFIGQDTSRSEQISLATIPATDVDAGGDSDSEDSLAIVEEVDDDEDPINVATHFKLGDVVGTSWEKRREKLAHDYAVTGWMLSPHPDIMQHVRKNRKGIAHDNAVNRLIRKLFQHEYPEEEQMDSVLRTFWSEYADFESRSGDAYDNRQYIWEHDHVKKQHCHIWHKQNTLPYTTVLGKLACRVTSKILGIGQAERSWGDVKHLKSNKRSHLSSERVKMQATIYGASCAARARSKRESAETTKTNSIPFVYWEEDDFQPIAASEEEDDSSCGSDTKVLKPKKIFNAWFEDWEEPIQKVKDPVHEAKLLKKYGGLRWFDPDSNQHFTAHAESLIFKSIRGNARGYSVRAVSEHHNESDGYEDSDSNPTVEPWLISRECAIHECIADYYDAHPKEGVLVKRTPNTKSGFVTKQAPGHNKFSPRRPIRLPQNENNVAVRPSSRHNSKKSATLDLAESSDSNSNESVQESCAKAGKTIHGKSATLDLMESSDSSSDESVHMKASGAKAATTIHEEENEGTEEQAKPAARGTKIGNETVPVHPMRSPYTRSQAQDRN